MENEDVQPRHPLSRRVFLKCSGLACLTFPFLLPAAEKKFRPLLDGSTTNGWHKPQPGQTHGSGGKWSVNGGVLEGEQDPPGSGNGGLLLSDSKFEDFELQFEFKPDWGVDSGVFFRCNEQGHGFQFYVDYHDGGNVGHLRGEMPGNFAMKPFQIYSTAPKGSPPDGFTFKTDPRAAKWPKDVYEFSCAPEQWAKVWRLNDWNTGRISCAGKFPVITTWVNDVRICRWNGETSKLPAYNREGVLGILGRSGSIGLQVHGGKGWPEGAKCRWRNIEIKEI